MAAGRLPATRRWARPAVPVMALAVVLATLSSCVSSSGAKAATGPSSKPRAATPSPKVFYGRFTPSLPTSPSFFPIAVWDQSPSGGNVPRQYKNQAQAFKAMGVNTFVGLFNWPERFGSDNGELAAAVAAHMYVIAGGNPASTSSPSSVASVQRLLRRVRGASQYLVGYQWSDEPNCNVSVASQVSTILREDPHRMAYENEGAWAAWLPQRNLLGSGSCLAASEQNLRATSVASADEYAITDPWHTFLCRHNGVADCLWAYGQEASQMRALVGPDKPVWVFVETGTNDLGLSYENGGVGEAKRASPAQVNSAAWLTILHGANGIEWFCDDTRAYDYCASNPTLAGNIAYTDHIITRFAPELNSPTIEGALLVHSSNPRVPISTMVKQIGGHTYLFVEGDRNGSTIGRFTLPGLLGAHATLIYDNNLRYDPKHAEWGKHFVLSGTGTFSDVLPSDYSVKIYEITPAG